jgi:crotonobetainyl-CoA:carnitine CoA-transferase CaiB-like acyl-CoA transferase
VVAVGNDAQFARFCEIVGVQPTSEWETNPGRVVRRDEVLAVLGPRIGEWSRDDLVAAMVEHDVPGGPVHSVGEAVAAMRTVDPEWITTVDGVPLPASPIRVDGARLPIRRPPPRLGEHTDEILGMVGVTADDLKVLRQQQVIT